MTNLLHNEIERLKNMLLSIGAMVEEALSKAIKSLEDRDPAMASEVMDNDPEIDKKEVELEEECLKVLALHQPVAIDLRFMVALLKINNDLERIGDLAVNIAERSFYLASKEPLDTPVDYKGIAGKAIDMVKKSLDSLVNMDSRLAHQVCEADDEVDEMNRQMFQNVQRAIKKAPERMDCLLQYMLVSRHLERVADHATNIGEDVIYMIEGEIVRHRLGETGS